MAKKIAKKSTRIQKKQFRSPFTIYWDRYNYLLLAGGFLLVIIGFLFMNTGSWDSFESLFISPIILFIAYVLIIPASIWYRKKKETKQAEEEVAPRQD